MLPGWLILLGLILLWFSPYKHLVFFPQTGPASVEEEVDFWVPDMSEQMGLSSSEWAEAQTFVRDSIIKGLNFEADSNLSAHICTFIQSRLGPNTGNDPSYHHHINAWQQWRILDGRDVSTYCVGYATIYQLFAGIAGLKTRMLAVSGNGINHIFCETYLKEQKTWALTDIMFDNVLLKDQNGDFIHSANYKDAEGICLLKNELCHEFEGASHFKYYTQSLYQFGYPFTYKAMAIRLISPEIETMVAGSKNSSYKYWITMGLIYLSLFLIIYGLFAWLFGKL